MREPFRIVVMQCITLHKDFLKLLIKLIYLCLKANKLYHFYLTCISCNVQAIIRLNLFFFFFFTKLAVQKIYKSSA